MELIKIEDNKIILNEEASKNLAIFETQIKQLKEQEDKIKQMILQEMEEKNVIKIETDDITITYVEPTDRETFDSKSFKEEHSDLYDDYIKISPVKSSIRIKVK